MNGKRMLAAVMLVAIGTVGFGGIAAARGGGSTSSAPPTTSPAQKALAEEQAARCKDALSKLSKGLAELSAYVDTLLADFDPQSPRESTIHQNKLARAQARLATVQARFDRVTALCAAVT